MDALPDKLKKATALQKIVDSAKPAKKELDELKFKIQMDMTKLGSSKMDPIDGYYALKVVTSTRMIEHPDELEDWFDMQDDITIDEYLTFDRTKILALADQIMEQDGEILPGIEVATTERVDIKQVKGKK